MGIAQRSSAGSLKKKRGAQAPAQPAESLAKAPPPGRPRSEAARTALLETAYSMMKAHPLGEITTQQIAAQAGVSTATVYRWWDTKEALLVDAFLHMKQQNVRLPESGSPLRRLREYSIAGGKFLQGEHGLVAARILGAIQDDAKLREHFTERFYVPHLSQMTEIAKQAVDAGELPPHTNLRLFLDMQFGACLARLLLWREPIHWQDSAAAFDITVAGAKNYRPAS